MSLINEMLRDLESRRAGELAKPDLQREIRALPTKGGGPTLRPVAILAVLFAIVGGAALAWWRWDGGPHTEDPPPVPVPAAAAVPAPIDRPQVVAAEALRLATSLESPPVEPASAAASVPNDTSLPAQKSEARPEKADAPAARPKAPEAPPSQQGSIEKTAVSGTPRERADADYRRAQSLLAAGQAAGAQDALLAALKQDAAYIPARQMLLRLLLEGRRVDEAAAVLQDGLALQPAQTGWAMALARLLVERGDAAGAERVLAGSAAYAAGNAEYAGFHGHLLHRAGQFRQAGEQYQAACRLSPGEGRWWFGLGQSFEAEGHIAEAREAFRRALATGNLNADLASLAEQKVR